jgi:hypothetical protein
MNSIFCGTRFYLAKLDTAFAGRNLEPGGNRGMTERRSQISCVRFHEENPGNSRKVSDDSAAVLKFSSVRDSKSRAKPSWIVNPSGDVVSKDLPGRPRRETGKEIRTSK